MTKLSDTQALILAAAAQRDNLIALPLPNSLRGGAAQKVVGSMLAKGLLQEVDADYRNSDPVWRETGDGHGTTLVATDAGLDAIGIEPEQIVGHDDAAQGAPLIADSSDCDVDEIDADAPAKARTSALDRMLDLLCSRDGVTISEAADAMGWLPHTTRGFISRKIRHGSTYALVAVKVDGRGKVFRIVTG